MLGFIVGNCTMQRGFPTNTEKLTLARKGWHGKVGGQSYFWTWNLWTETALLDSQKCRIEKLLREPFPNIASMVPCCWRLRWCRMPQPVQLEPVPSGHQGSL